MPNTAPSPGRAVLVLGAAGFIGRHLVERLVRQGTRVVAATRAACEFDHPLVTNRIGEFTRPVDFATLLDQCGAVIHAASQSTPGSASATPQVDGNLRTTLALVEALQNAPDCRCIYLSSAGTLYGERSTPARETDPLHPRSYHGAGKAAAEHFLQAWSSQYRGTAMILRPTNVYGPGQFAQKGFAIVPTAMNCALTGASLHIYGDGSQIRDYIHVTDLVALCVDALRHPVEPSCHVYNASSGHAINLNQLLSLIEDSTGRTINRMYRPARISDIRTILVSSHSAQETFGWSPAITLDQGLEETWQWHVSRI